MKVSIDRRTHEVVFGSKRSEPTPREFRIAVALQDAHGDIMPREELMKLTRSGPGSDVRLIDQHVARIRSKLGRGRDAIKTVSCYGYRWMGQ